MASLKALRGVAHAPSALGRKPYIGFANPLLDGDPDRESDKGNAAVAQQKDNCANTTKVRELFKLRAVFASAGATLLGGETGVDALRHLTPIPQTADLVCDVGQALGSGEDDIFLGARATETAVKDLSTSGRLSSYTIVNFATHGLVTGNMEGIAEPGLVLTPPAAGSATDDGYLSASEVATLKLDADWVILSACNTAAGGAADADALSGLARAFFYAGSRSLIVSHWSVSENAAVKLVTRATEILRADPAIGRAEAFRRAMQSLATSGAEAESHPAILGTLRHRGRRRALERCPPQENRHPPQDYLVTVKWKADTRSTGPRRRQFRPRYIRGH